MYKKAKITLFVVCLMNLIDISWASAQTLVLHHANGTTTDVQLYTMPQVKFEGDKVLITSTVLNMEYPKQDVLRFTYKGGTLGISSPNAKGNVSQENGHLVFHGIKVTDPIAVHTSNGIRVPVRIQRGGSTATLPLNALSKGIYLITINGRTFKFTKP